MKTKSTILVFSDAYLPGYKCGGPIRTLANMVEQLGDEFAFRIVTRDRETCDSFPYPGCCTATWQHVGKAQVIYFSPHEWTVNAARRVLLDTDYDIVYLNSLFSRHFTIVPLVLQWARLVPRRPTILAPRGELSPGALRLKSVKKHTFLRYARIAGLYRNARWQASAAEEEADIRRCFGSHIRVAIAPNFRAVGEPKAADHVKPRKEAGKLKIAFLSRIDRKKNLHGTLRLLAGVRGNVTLHIYGPKVDPAYWDECERNIADLPGNIQVEDHGAVPHDEVLTTLARHDLFLLPTLGENFGHVFVEAFLAGVPIVISDRTPWRGLADMGVGYDLPLERPEAFRKAIQRFVDMGDAEHRLWSRRAQEYGRQAANDPDVVEANRRLFLAALGREPRERRCHRNGTPALAASRGTMS